MRRLGLTGGIAAGKSVASRRFAELGAVVIDYDQLARDAVKPGSPGLAAITQRFGTSVLGPDGSLDRAKLGALVFADDDARRDLECIVHPAVFDLAAKAEQAAQAAYDAGAWAGASAPLIVVHDIPLLVESGVADEFDLVVVVDAPASLRQQRLLDGRGLTPAAAQAQIAAQISDGERLAAADVVLDGSDSEADLIAQVDRLWAQVRAW